MPPGTPRRTGSDVLGESGTGGTPLVLVHGGYGLASEFDASSSSSPDRQVIAIELQGHGHTADVDRPFT